MDAFHIDLRTDQREAIDGLADQFEREFKAGKTPRIEEYLDQEPALRNLLLLKLLAIEVELRRFAGDRISINEYDERFPGKTEFLRPLITPGLSSVTDAGASETDSILVARDENQTVAHPTIADREPGQLVGHRVGPYLLEERIGSGGMGDVYRANHTLLGRHRAIKVIRSDFARSGDAVKRFVREAQATSDLRHPNIVTLYEVDQEGATLYLVMELLEGEDLASLVARSGPLEMSKAVHCVEQVAEGLRFAHKLGYVHRDVKPHNIIVTKSGEVKLLDLGLAKLTETADQSVPDSTAPHDGIRDVAPGQLTQAYARLGTPAYMSPEQRNDPKIADARSDIYSLGRTLIYLLGGPTALRQTSEEGNNRVQPMRGTDALQKLPSCIPESIGFVIGRMISPNADGRFPNADQLVSALRHWQKTHASPVFACTSLKSIRRRLIWITFAIVFFTSMVPSALQISYNVSVLSSLSAHERDQFHQSMVVANATIFPIGVILRIGAMVLIVRPFSKIEKGTFDFAFLPVAKNRCLRVGLVFFALGLLEWLAFSIIVLPIPMPHDVKTGIVFTTVLCGLLTAVIYYFCLTPIALKVAYPALFRLDLPDDGETGRLSRLSRRIIVVQLLATVLPFAAMTFYQLAPMNARAAPAFVVWLMVISLIVAVLITFLVRSLQADISMFQEALRAESPSAVPGDARIISR